MNKFNYFEQSINMKILITGARSGIGFQTGVILANMGHTVYFTTRTEKQESELKKELEKMNLKGETKVFKLDICNRDDREKILKLDLDCLINNAAICYGGSILDLEMSKVRENFEVNYFDTLKLVKLFIEDLTKKDKPGNVVIVSSIAGILPIPFLASYASTKAALLMTATILHQELLMAKSKIRIKLIEPGLYHTGFNQVMMNDAKETSKNSEYFRSTADLIQLEDTIIRFLELNKTTSIAKKVASAATSKSIRLKYRAPFSQVLGTKLYMLLFK